jgi:cell division septum initiation protein DivIVA
MDMAFIQSAVVSLKAATDIASGLVKLKTGAELQAKVAELNAQILSAQTSAIAANAEQFALLEKVRQLEKHIAELEAWNAEKKRYALAELCAGVIAYLVKPEARGGEPVHAICANCYEHGHKSILQYRHDPASSDLIFECSRCQARAKGWPGDDFPLRRG